MDQFIGGGSVVDDLTGVVRLLLQCEDSQTALANATYFHKAFGHVAIAWVWLDITHAAIAMDQEEHEDLRQGYLAATSYFFGYELPSVKSWLAPVRRFDRTYLDLPSAAL